MKQNAQTKLEYHDFVLGRLYERLLTKGYDVVLRNPTYSAGGLEGELDIIALRDNHAHYYEVKGSTNFTGERKARRQLKRVMRAFPDWEVKGIYHTGSGVTRRIRINAPHRRHRC